jgi:diguanylate cyclase (GGDEF)-like protein
MRGRKRKFLSIIFMLTAFAALQAGSETVKELGSPFIRNYTPDEYVGHAQNWAVAQDQRGITYFGNTNGLLEFDGRNWNLIQLPNNLAVRSLAIDGQGRVYIGSMGEFGFLAGDTQGKTVYVSLLHKLKKDDQTFNDVWKTFAASHGVYFLTLKKVFRLLNDRIEVIPVHLVRRYGFAIGDELFIAQNNKGIFLVRNGQPQLLPYSERFTNPEAGYVYMLPYRERQVFIIDGEGNFYTYDLNAFYDPQRQAYDFDRQTSPAAILKPFATEISAYINKNSNSFYNGISIPGGRYALATLKGGIVIMNDQGKLERVINKNRGLMDNNIWNLCLDREQNLWAALNTGIAYVAISSPISCFDAATGLEGYLAAVTRFKERIFVGSFIGVCVLDDYQLKLRDDNYHFTSLHPELRDCWGFLPLGDYLLTASSPKVLLIDPRLRYQAFGNDSFYALGQTPKFPGTIFAGLMDGLGIFTVRSSVDGNPSLTFRKDVFKKISDPIRRIIPDDNGNLWLSTSSKGLIHIRFRSLNLDDYEVTRCGVSEGLPQVDWDYVHLIDGRLLVGTQKGIYEGIPATPDPPRTPPTRFHPETTFGKFFLEPPATVQRIMKDDQNRWWVQSSIGIGVVSTDAEGNYRLRRDCFAPIPLSDEMSHLDEQGILWVPTNKGLYRFDPAVIKDYQTFFPALIHQVTAGKDKILFQGNHYDPLSKHGNYFTRLTLSQPRSMVPTLAYERNTLFFNFTTTFYEHDAALRFKYILEGFDKMWSEWTAQNTKEYTNLPEGSYAFRVKARNIYEHESSEAVFRFIISPPWYRTWPAYLGFAVIGFGLLAGGVRAYTFKLRREKERLEKIVALRTQELKEASLTDALTGLRNRRYINEILSSEITAFINFKKFVLEGKERRRVTEQHRAVFGVLIFDIDHFKMVNDTYGHDAGDQVLQQFAQILRSSVRADDAVMRLGGEEFLVVLKKTMPEYPEIFAQKIKQKIQECGFQISGGVVLKRTCSIGLALFPFYEQNPSLISFEQTIMVADLGLYYAKQHGRNMAVMIQRASNVPADTETIQNMVTSLDFALKMDYFSIKT